MAFVLQAVIASAGALAQAQTLEHAVVVHLGHGLSMLPMTRVLFDELQQDSSVDPAFTPCVRFPAGFDGRLAGWSHTDPVAYVEADYWAGTGMQFSSVWHGGAIVVGPLLKQEDEPTPEAGSPISQALRRLGVVARAGGDEFDAVDLIRHRRVSRWIEQGQRQA